MEYKIEKPYPLYKLVQEEIPDRRGGYSINYTIYVTLGKDLDWYELYNTFSRPWAEIALQRLKDIFEIYILDWILNKNEPVMFEVNDQIYKTEYVFPDQSCICGSTIVGNQRYGEFSVDAIKFDYIHDIIFFYYEGDCLLKCNQLFLNGSLLLNSQQLDDVCKSIGQDKTMLDCSPYKLLKYISNTYPDAKTFKCENCTIENRQQYK